MEEQDLENGRGTIRKGRRKNYKQEKEELEKGGGNIR